MRVLFIYTDVSSEVGFSAGIGVLSAILKKEGHETKLIHVSNDLDYPLDQERINVDVNDYQPGLICFSVTTNQWYFARQIGQGIKREFDIPIIVGGIHASSDPDKVMTEPWVDMLCRGEGDNALPEVVRRIESGRSLDGIPNLMHRKHGEVVRERLGAWVDNLDSLPFEDREIFDYGKIVDTRSGWAEVMVTRGCPFPCTYCFNQPMFNEYRKELRESQGVSVSKKNYVRRRSVGGAMEMLKAIKKDYPNVRGFTFVDDIMAMDRKWFKEFARRYPEEVGLPYACTSHPLVFNRNIAKLLKVSGCKVVKMGVEAGNVEIRKKVLRRNISNAHLMEVFGIARELGLKPQAFNMIGLPGETIENMIETVRLNALMKPYIVWVSTFNPYPATALYRECEKRNMIDESKCAMVHSYRGESVLKDKFLPPIEFKKIRVMFRWHLNNRLENSAQRIYRDNIEALSSLPEDQWRDGTAEKIFQEIDPEIDECLRKKHVDHYVSKKYINIYWGQEYDYDLT